MKFLKKNLIKNQRGFTFMEVLMAIVILSVALPPLIIVMSSVVLDSHVNAISDTGSYLAERELERILSYRFDAVVNEPSTNYTGNFSDYAREVSVSAFTGADPTAITNVCGFTTAQCKKVQITITHSNGASVYLTTVATNT